jgi:hypothetical protein
MRKPVKLPTLHPRAQVIITGTKLASDQAQTVIKLSEALSLRNWCAEDGSIGHLDSIEPNTSFESFIGDLKTLAQVPYLNMGVSVMNGPPGTFVTPIASFLIKNGEMTKTENVHVGHPPPRRLKKKVN